MFTLRRAGRLGLEEKREVMLDTPSSLTETAFPSLRKAFLRLGNACKLRGVVNTETLWEIAVNIL
jgi:hypothetical protein